MPSEGGFESSLPAPCWMIAVMLLWFGSVEIGFCMARTKLEKMGEQRGNVFETLKSDERKRKKEGEWKCRVYRYPSLKFDPEF